MPGSQSYPRRTDLRMRGKLIGMVAMTAERVIGKNGDLPWHLPEDLKLFKRTTSGHPILMGRKTFDSIGRPLPKRRNLVLTRDRDWSAEGIEVLHEVAEVDSLIGKDETAFIIGGAEIYRLFLPEMDELLVSHVYESYEGDTIFPEFEPYFELPEIVETFAKFELRRYRRKS